MTLDPINCHYVLIENNSHNDNITMRGVELNSSNN